jgi:2-hydroxy-3-oxopropionate reductase
MSKSVTGNGTDVMTAPSIRFGVVGLGIMGRPMAINLLHAGYSVTVFNRSRAVID